MILDPNTATNRADNEAPVPFEQVVSEIIERRRVTIGLPSGRPAGESRFAVTPEGAAQLTERRFAVLMEAGAGEPIHYNDHAYVRAGVDIVNRSRALRADVVITTAPLLSSEPGMMRRGAMLITLRSCVMSQPNYARALVKAGVNVVAADLISIDGHRPVADILHEIDGCASMSVASSLLADPLHGKGILLGGVTGIVPCEITVIGSGMGAIAAAHNAMGLGATVHMFDNDLYSLRSASRVLDHRAIASALHPHVLRRALRSADVVVVTPTLAPVSIDSDTVAEMKSRAIIFDLTASPGATFPSVKTVNLAEHTEGALVAEPGRVCYSNVGCRVPRTTAMALSNALVANVHALTAVQGSLGQIPASLRPAMMLFWGKCVNSDLAEALGIRALNLNLLTGN